MRPEDQAPDISDTIGLQEEIARSRAKALDLLKYSDRSERELRRKLRERGFSDEAVDDAVAYAYSFHYLDDVRFAENFIRSRRCSLSTMVIRGKLLEKGISPSDIDDAFERVAEESEDSTDYTGAGAPSGELTAAVSALRKKLRGMTVHEDPEEAYRDGQKILAYMYRKGFSPDITKKALETVNNSGGD